MNELQVITEKAILEKEFKIYGTLETPLFLAKDVAERIEHNKPSEMCNMVDEDEKLKATISLSGQMREVLFLTEDGLYEVLMQSRKPIAKEFKKQVKLILKEIRKNGGYIVEKENDTPEEIMARALIVAQETLKRRDERIKALEIVVTEQTPKVEFADKLLKSKDCILIRDYAKILFDENINIGEKRLYKWLRENKYLMSDNLPYQSYMKYFSVKENSFDTAFGVKITKTTLINPEGQLYFYHKLKNKQD